MKLTMTFTSWNSYTLCNLHYTIVSDNTSSSWKFFPEINFILFIPFWNFLIGKSAFIPLGGGREKTD